MNNQKKKFFKIIVIGGIHGNERTGIEVVKKINDLNLPNMTALHAHPEAITQGVRFIERDLNRSFPGMPKGVYEERLAYNLLKILQKYDVVIDVHGMECSVDRLSVITTISPTMRNLLYMLGFSYNVYLPYTSSKDFSYGGLISHVPIGISLEYGPSKSIDRSDEALQDILRVYNQIHGEFSTSSDFNHKQYLYTYDRKLIVDSSFIPTAIFKDFHKVSRGNVIGYVGTYPIQSRSSYYPVFVHRDLSDGNLAIITKRRLL